MSENMQNNNNPMPFSWKNYALMGIGVLTIVIGFVLMSGGGEHTVTEFDSSIYSTRRITIAPIVVLVGFAIEIVAIMLRFDRKDATSANGQDKENK